MRAGCPGDGHPYASACGEWDYMGYIWLCDDAGENCNEELFRWITPYSSPGRWVVDVSSVLPRIRQGGDLKLEIEGSYTYRYTLDFRFSDREDGAAPSVLENVYAFGAPAWDSTYADSFPPTTFTPPAGTSRVFLHATISGHGASDPQNCAEFCTHEHVVTINDTPFDKTYEMDSPGTYGCADRVEEGVVPNQGGTWFYDRAAWCPGWPVYPWLVEITDAVDLEGENTLEYISTYMGGDPVGGGAHMRVEMNLVYWQ